MTKFLNRWLRQIHRWVAIPFVIAIVVLIASRGTAIWGVVQRVQIALMLAMALTGSYLFLLPYLTKWQRRARTKRN